MDFGNVELKRKPRGKLEKHNVAHILGARLMRDIKEWSDDGVCSPDKILGFLETFSDSMRNSKVSPMSLLVYTVEYFHPRLSQRKVNQMTEILTGYELVDLLVSTYDMDYNLEPVISKVEKKLKIASCSRTSGGYTQDLSRLSDIAGEIDRKTADEFEMAYNQAVCVSEYESSKMRDHYTKQKKKKDELYPGKTVNTEFLVDTSVKRFSETLHNGILRIKMTAPFKHGYVSIMDDDQLAKPTPYSFRIVETNYEIDFTYKGMDVITRVDFIDTAESVYCNTIAVREVLDSMSNRRYPVKMQSCNADGGYVEMWLTYKELNEYLKTRYKSPTVSFMLNEKWNVLGECIPEVYGLLTKCHNLYFDFHDFTITHELLGFDDRPAVVDSVITTHPERFIRHGGQVMTCEQFHRRVMGFSLTGIVFFINTLDNTYSVIQTYEMASGDKKQSVVEGTMPGAIREKLARHFEKHVGYRGNIRVWSYNTGA